MSLGMTYSPTVSGEGLQVTNFDQCLHTVVVIGKCIDVFRGIFFIFGGGEGSMWLDLFLEEYAIF